MMSTGGRQYKGAVFLIESGIDVYDRADDRRIHHTGARSF